MNESDKYLEEICKHYQMMTHGGVKIFAFPAGEGFGSPRQSLYVINSVYNLGNTFYQLPLI